MGQKELDSASVSSEPEGGKMESLDFIEIVKVCVCFGLSYKRLYAFGDELEPAAEVNLDAIILLLSCE